MSNDNKQIKIKKVNKSITSVDNPSIKKNTTRKIGSINFSKSNFVSLGKWVLIIVLFLYFGSYTINGFVASNITKNSTEETIVHEYKKIIGYDQPSGYFDYIESFEDLSSLVGKKIYFKELYNGYPISELLATYQPRNIYGRFFEGTSINNTANIYFYNSNDEFVSFASYLGQIRQINNSIYITKYSANRDNSNFIITDLVIREPSFSYFILENYKVPVNTQYMIDNINVYRDFLNYFFYLDEDLEPVPIYEITRYEYPIKDINYNWDYKLKQISKFRPLFKNDNIYFKNEEYSDLFNLNTFIIPTMSSNDYKQKKIEEKILIDEKVVKARDLGVIDSYSFSSYRETSWFNDNDNSFFYLTLNDVSSSGNYELTELVYYLNSNYVTNYSKDNYKKLLESDNFGFDDMIIFPIRLVGNLVYNFGVLIGVITIW